MLKKIRRQAPLILLLTLTIIGCKAQEQYSPLFCCSKVMSAPYGICSHINRPGERNEYDTRFQDLAMMDNVGVNIIRTDFDWWRMKAQNDSLNYLFMDSMVTSVHEKQKSILGILTIDKRKDVTNDWRNYVVSISKHYKNRVVYWEILNEQDLIHRYVSGFYANQYVPFLKDGHKAVKQGNKRAKVLFSGVSNIYNGNLDSILRQDVASYFDIMNVHSYTWLKSSPEGLLDFYKKLKDIMEKYEIDKPVWLSETGASTFKEGGVSELVQMERVPRIYLISFALGVDKVFWYKSRSCELDSANQEDHFGLWHKDYTPKPAYYAYQTLTRMCPNKSTRPKLERIGNIYVASWKRPDKKKAWALWAPQREEIISIDLSENFKAYDITGNTITINPVRFKASPSIIYIIGSKKLEIRD